MAPKSKAVAAVKKKAKKPVARPANAKPVKARPVELAIEPPPASAVSTAAAATPCNICGGTSFKAGPRARLSVGQLPPVCTACGSLERHRTYRTIFDNIRGPSFKEFSCLSFSKDRSYAGGWFASIRHCGPGTDNPLDVQRIDLPDESVDVVICNYLLASVPRYEQGFREIARVISKRGFAFVSIPNPHYRQATLDWGQPRKEHHGQYRSFGEDIEAKLPTILPNLGIVRLVSADPVTGQEDRAYILSKNSDFLGRLGERGMRIRFLQF